MYRPQLIHQQTQIIRWFKDVHSKSRTTNFMSSELDYLGATDHFRCLHVVLSDHSSPEQFTNLTLVTNLHRATWVVFINEDMEHFFKHSNLPFSLDLLAARVVSNTRAEIYDVYRVDQNQPIRIIFLGFWTLASGFEVQPKFIYNRRFNLEGITLRVGIIQNWPTSYEVGNNTWAGFFPSIWHQIEEFTNMTSLKIRANSTGSKRRNGEWSGLIGMAINGQIDAIVSELTLDVNRVHILDFSQPLVKARYQIYFKQPGFLLNWVAVFKPFPLPLWQTILVWAISSSIASFLFQLILRKFQMETQTLSLLNCLFFTLQSLSQQGRDKVPRSLACRILFFTSYLVSAVVMPAYAASLISSLTQKTPNHPFNSIDGMLKEGSYRLLVPNETAEYDYFANTNDPALSKAYVNHVQKVPPEHVMRNYNDAIATVCNQKKYAFFGIDAIISRKIFRQPGPPCNIIPMTKPVATVHLNIALAKKHPLHPFIKYQIGLMIERGILSRIEAETWPLLTKPTAETWTEVHGEEVFPIFTFLGCGILLSIMFLFCELISHKRQLKKHEFALEFVN